MLRIAGCILLLGAAAPWVYGQPPTIPTRLVRAPGDRPQAEVLVFLPQRLFAEEEFEPALRQLSLAGVRTRIASSDTTTAIGIRGIMVKPDLAFRDARTEDYAGLMLIGGSGAALHWDDSLLHAWCREFAESGRVVAAIGIAPITLARAGVLKGRKATVFHERSAVNWLRQSGARFVFRQLVSDRNIITAASAQQARMFGRTVAATVHRNTSATKQDARPRE